MAWIALLVLGMLAAGPAPAQEAIASLDRQAVFAGDTVMLRIEVSDPAVDRAPDYAALAADFDILDTGTSARVEIVNSRRRMQVTYSATLEPRREGEIVIPSLPVAGTRTQPLTLTVMKSPAGRAPGDHDLFIEVEAEPRDPYVHAQVRLTVRLYHAAPITEGALNPEQWPDGAVVERLGDDTTYQTRLAGQRYRVIERRYWMFPERSGPLTVPEIRFRGRVADAGRGMNSLFSSGRLVTVRSAPIELEVRPQPASFSGQVWLPAASFEVTESWPQGDPVFTVGEPLTRTLVTRARGLLAAQLPEYSMPPIDGVKVYPDQPASQTRTDGSWAVAQREEKFALVPTRAGALTLPAIRIPWWDTEADRERVVVIPAREIRVEAGAAALPSPAPAESLSPSATESDRAGRPLSAPWWREVAALMTVLWLWTLALWWRARAPVRTPSPEPPEAPSLRALRREFERASGADDAAAASRALLEWASSAAGTPVTSLAALARRLDDDAAAAAVGELERALYAPGDEPWRGAELIRAIGGRLRWRPRGPRAARSPALPPLYPDAAQAPTPAKERL